MKPVFRIVAGVVDITALINDRLLMLRTVDKPGMESDEFELRLDDRDSALSLPRRGEQISIELGYSGSALHLVGRYRVDAVEFSGPPDVIVVRGGAADSRSSGKTQRSGSWESVPLATIVKAVAARNGWTAACPVTTVVPRADQLAESDFSFVTRLARQYDCTAKLASGHLVVIPRQSGQTVSGKVVAPLVLTRGDLSRFSFRFQDTTAQSKVRARYQDKPSGQLRVVEIGNDGAPSGLPAVHTDRHLHPDKTAAERAAAARVAAFNRSTAAVRLEMGGRTDVFAERRISVSGLKDGLDGEYLAESVEQVFTRSGWNTTVECNAGRQGKAKAAGKKKKPQQQLKVVDLG